MLEAEIDFALIQEPNMHVIRSFLSSNTNSGYLNSCFIQSPVCRAAIVYSPRVSLDFLEHLSTPDCAVARIRLAGLPYLIASAYFDGERNIQDDLIHLENVIQMAPNGRLLLHADSNARHEIWFDHLTSARGRELVNWITRNGLHLLNRPSPPTFMRDDGSGFSWIDLTFVDFATREIVVDWHVDDELDLDSDHRVIQISLSSQCAERRSFSTRCFSQTTRHLQELRLAVIDAAPSVEIIPEVTPSAAIGKFGERLLQLCVNTLPHKRRPRPKRSLLWWDDEVRSARAHKNRLISRLKNCTSGDRFSLNEQLKMARLQYRSLIIKKGPLHWRAFMRSVGLGRIYGVLRSLGRPPIPIKPLCGPDELPLASDDAAAEHLATTFFGDCVSCPKSSTLTTSLSSIQHDYPIVSSEEIEQHIASFGRSKAPGPDGITTDILRSLFDSCSSSFVECINLCLRHSTFPNLWKVGAVVMIPKNRPGPAVAKSYRPITLLPIIGKILERIIASRIMGHIESLNLLHPSQYGFRSDHSTTDALCDLNAKLNSIRKSHRRAVLISLDITGAFDSAKWSDIIAALQSF